MEVSDQRKWELAAKLSGYRKWKGASFALRFCLYSTLGLGILYLGQVDFILQPILVLLAKLVAGILSLTGLTVIILGQKVVLPGVFGIDIATECSGAPQMIILASALLAYPTTYRFRLIGLALFMVTISLGNILRLVSLFWIGIWSKAHFDFVHAYIWGGLGYVGLFLLWMVWIRIAAKPSPEQ